MKSGCRFRGQRALTSTLQETRQDGHIILAVISTRSWWFAGLQSSFCSLVFILQTPPCATAHWQKGPRLWLCPCPSCSYASQFFLCPRLVLFFHPLPTSCPFSTSLHAQCNLACLAIPVAQASPGNNFKCWKMPKVKSFQNWMPETCTTVYFLAVLRLSFSEVLLHILAMCITLRKNCSVNGCN
jgi:hypothetical protein